jgi:hypothetical protein
MGSAIVILLGFSSKIRYGVQQTFDVVAEFAQSRVAGLAQPPSDFAG